jgi:hypothetical protein
VFLRWLRSLGRARPRESRRPVPLGPASKCDECCGSGVRRLPDGSGPDLVEARAAVHGAIVTWRERNHRLAPATATDRSVELPRTTGRSGAFRYRPARGTTLRVVQQTLATEKRLLAAGEDELLRTIAAGQRSVLVHPLPNLLCSPVAAMSRPPSELPDRPHKQEGSVRIGLTGTRPETRIRENTCVVKRG